MKKLFKKRKFIVGLIAIFVLLAVAGFVIIPKVTEKQENNREVLTTTTLKEIINVSELSTFTATYNGVAQVMNKEKPDQIDYYVSYEATVMAGIDFDKVIPEIRDEEKVIRIPMPPVYITNVDVDIDSLDYIFLNSKANAVSVSQEAYKACVADAQNESEQQEAILDLATQNAKNSLTALTRPIIEQLYADYTLEIE